MPNIKSAIKRARQNEKRRMHRASQKSALKTAIKKYLKALEAGDLQAAEPLLREACRKLDKAVTKGLIHKNAAARKKSRLMQKFNKAVQQSGQTEQATA
ncbi:MAG: 30S ribosomal protein S20 [Calditerricola sp.]|jgi:ribosomal protein S20|nr:30S ribosomal protein S20 [Bacillota bacterium]MCG0314292.1 30S ribosomal protein S20 [Calditerricola sp.]